MKGFVSSSWIGLTTVGCLLSSTSVGAQIVPDNTLGPDSSIVVPNQTIRNIPSDRIDGGAIRGNNLFHSFQDFNVDVGRGAYFANPDGIANILSRVTGDNLSNIFGTLGVLGNANLFLVNPNGIVFGPNARLDVSGSFFATTNSGFIFENGFEFTGNNPDAPPLLTINIPIGIRLRENPAIIENQSRALDSRSGDVAGLQVPSGQTLGLIGGEIFINNGALTAPGGRIELAGVSGLGTVQFQTEDGTINGLEIPRNVSREDIAITNGAIVNVIDNDGGDIIVDGRNVDVSEFSVLLAGIAPEEGTPDSQSGNIEINASEDFQLFRGSLISNQVGTNAQGNAGDISITAENVSVKATVTPDASERVSLSSSSFGQGNAGNIIITANDRTSFDGDTAVFSSIAQGGEGFGGNVRISTGDFSMTDGSQLQASTRGRGDAGNVEIEASRSVSLEGIDANELPTAVFSSVTQGAVGNGGNVDISTGSLSVSNGAYLESNVQGSASSIIQAGQGNAGIININATGRVSFDGMGSGAFSTLGTGASGSAGNVLINAGSIFVSNGARLNTSTAGLGDAGTVRINAQNLVSLDSASSIFSNIEPGATGNSGGIEINTSYLRVTNGSQLQALVRSITDDGTILATQGNAGSIRINANDTVTLDNTAILSTVGFLAFGDSGSIEINTNNLFLTNGGQLQTQTQGFGNAGSIEINATNNVRFEGFNSNGASSSAFSTVEPGATGDSGTISITARSVEILDGGTLTASVNTDPSFTIASGQGNAGSIEINATDNVLFEGGGAFSILDLGAVGQGGDITIRTANLSVTEGAVLDVGMRAATVGNAGNIIIEANENVLFDGAIAFSRVERFAEGNSGNIEITTGNLSVLNGGQLQVQMFGIGTAGNILVNATDSVLFDGASESGLPSAAFSTLEVGAIGEAGSIDITANRNVAVVNGAQLQVQTSGFGNAGSINIFAADSVLFQGGAVGENFNPFTSGAFSRVESTGFGNSGDIKITTGSLNVLNGSTLETSIIIGETGRVANAGEIRIDAAGDVTFDGVGNVDSFNTIGNVDLSINDFFKSGARTRIDSGIEGNSGNIIINAENLGVTNGALLEARNSGIGVAGNIDINVRNNATFDGAGEDNVVSRASTVIGFFGGGIGGNVDISAINLSVTNGAQLDASIDPLAVGFAGNVIVNTSETTFFDGFFQFEDVNEIDNSIEEIRIIPSGAFTIIGERALGIGGAININTENLSVTNGAQLQAQVEGEGNAGDVIVTAQDSVFFDNSGAFTTVNPGAAGEGGNINIAAGTVSLDNFALLQAATGGLGNAGSVTVDTGNLFVFNGSQVQAQTQGLGNAGPVTINASSGVFFDGFSITPNGQPQFSEASTIVDRGGFGFGGDVTINTQNLSVTNGAGLSASTLGFGSAGTVIINAAERVYFDGEGLDIPSNANSAVGAFAIGDGGQIVINTRNISFTNGSGIFTGTFGQGDIDADGLTIAGDIIIQAQEDVYFDNSFVASTVESGANNAQGGTLSIIAEDLLVANGGQIQAQTEGQGNAGSIILSISDRVLFDGTGSNANSGVANNATGEGGRINISANNISFTNGAALSTSTSGEGNAGNITIQAQEDVYFDESNAFSTVEEGAVNVEGGTIRITAEDLVVTNGGQLQALTRGIGNAGRVIIETSDNVRFEGLKVVNNEGFPSAASSSVEDNAIGSGGNVSITTDRLYVENLALISASNNNAANQENPAGDIDITAETVNLSEGRIFTITRGGDGGNIDIDARDTILRNGSQIRTDAGVAGAGGNGGNVTINTELLVGLNRSHIAANAFFGSGGKIEINADGIFVFEFYSRERLEELFGTDVLIGFDPTILPRSSITSISLTDPSLSGVVELNTQFDPSSGLIELPRNVVDPNDLINQDICRQGQDSEFYIRGRGGIQATPDDKLDGDGVDVDLVEPVPSRQRNRPNTAPDQSQTEPKKNQPISSLDVVPARGWIRDENGDVILVGYDPTKTGVQRSRPQQQVPHFCPPISETEG